MVDNKINEKIEKFQFSETENETPEKKTAKVIFQNCFGLLFVVKNLKASVCVCFA